MDVQLAKRNAEALKGVIATLKQELKEQRALMESPIDVAAYQKASAAVEDLTLKIRTLEKVQRSATPASAYESFISGDVMNSNTLRQAQRGAKNRLNTVNEFVGDQTARQFLNDIDKTQMRLNRLQAGFTKPLQSVKRELNDLSGGELKRLLTLLQQEQTLVQGNDRAWAAYAVAIGKVEERMREYDTIARQTMGAQTLAKSQSGGFAQANERDIQRAIEKLQEYRAVINDPNGAGKATWEATSREITKLQANLDGLKQKAAEASGQAMSIDTAVQTGMQALNGTFKGTSQQLALAKKALQEQLALTERGTAEYKKLQQAIQGVEMEEKRMGMTQKEIDAILKNPKGKSYNELKIAVEQGRAALANMRTTTESEKKAFDALAKSVKEADIQMKQLAGSSKGTASAFDKAWSRLKTYVGLYVGAAVAMQKIVATMGDLMELSDKMGEVRKTTGFTADEVGRLSDNLKKLDVRTSLTSLMELSSLAGSVGLKTEQDVQGFTEAANQLLIALPEMGNESARTLIKIAQATGDLQKNNNDVRETLEKVGSTIIALRANSASAAGPITDFVSRVGAVGAQAGISIDQIAAMGSTIDALGGRVEMSATALSRMIPAIRNNSYAVANSIGVTESYLKSLSAMDQMVLIFQKLRDSIKGINTETEEGQQQMADNIEAVLGKNAVMAEVMKDLNQQGARAGIVFGLLSQNVDELQKQLGIAGEAYKDNIALQEEFNKMNDTTAAKWERLKNQLEEMFVSDSAQRGLGKIIDFLRDIVDLLSGNSGISVALRSILIYIGLVRIQLVSIAAGALRSILGGLKNIGVALGFIKGEMTAAQWGNIFTAAAAAIWIAVDALGVFRRKTTEAFKEAGKLAQQIVDTEQAVEKNFKTVSQANTSIDEANKKLKAAQNALEKAKKAMDGSEESAERLKKAEDDLAKAEREVSKAEDSHRTAIDNINKIYGKYLGFTLSEISSKKELAAAQDLVNSKLREELTLKQRSAALNRVEDEMGGGRDEAFGVMSQALGNVFRKQVKVKHGKGREQTGWANDTQRNSELLRQMTKMAQEQKLSAEQIEKALADAGVSIYETSSGGKKRVSAYGARLRNVILNYSKEYHDVREKVAEVETQFEVELSIDREKQQENLQKQYEQSEKTYSKLEQKHAKATGEAKKKAAADLLKQADTLQDMIKNAGNFYKLDNKEEKKAYDKFISDTQKRSEGIEAQREALIKEAGALYQPASGGTGGTGGGGGGSHPYGTYDRVKDPYEKWDADSLVARRKEMLERVRSLANGADVQKVLSEDAKFISEATRKNIKTTQQAIEWYNTERLKIQDALHEKHLTNTGDWMDPKKGGRKAKKMVQDEMKYYLDELDAYYTERKAKIQEARNDEQISEAEAWNRNIKNEAEWQRRKGELLKLYGTRRKEVTKEEADAIFDILSERTDDSVDYIKKDIEHTVKFIERVGSEKSKAAMDKIYGDIDLKTEQAFLRQRNAIGKHLKVIEDIVNKERPFNGIADNMRENLGKMGILTADMAEDADSAAEELKRVTFLLGESENAYTMTVDKLLEDMRQNGFKEWADVVSKDTNMQQGLLAMLRTTFDAVQEAIKKESSIIKKQVEIMMQDITEQVQSDTTRLQMLENSVSRANSLISAGPASERVADKLAMKQIQLQITMQETRIRALKKAGADRVALLRQEAELLKQQGELEKAKQKRMDAENVEKSVGLTLTKEQAELDKQRVALSDKLEESQSRLYKSLREWGELISSSLQSVFEASNTGQADFYTEQAKKRLTGEATTGTYIVVENAGTKNAEASYQTLTDEEVLRIEQENAMAEAWKKVMDDINMKISETITDQINAWLQNKSVDANTDALGLNTRAVQNLTEAVSGKKSDGSLSLSMPPTISDAEWKNANTDKQETPKLSETPPAVSDADPESFNRYKKWLDDKAQADADYTKKTVENAGKRQKSEEGSNQKITASTQSAFAKMTAAANLYGAAYQAMSNDNLDMTQKFEMIALQAVGNAAMAGLEVALQQAFGMQAANMGPAAARSTAEAGPFLGPVLFGVLSALVGGLMGFATSKVAKSKSKISSITGASASAGRLSTGMLTYAEGNVNEFSDPNSLTPGKHYNVDAADGKTYRARYMGKGAKTHITNGPEFHLVGEAGREAIIDAKTTRNIQMNDPEIWRSIQTLYNGGSLSTVRRRDGGVRAFAEGNLEEIGDMGSTGDLDTVGGLDMTAMTDALNRQTAVQEALLERLSSPIKAEFNVYGPKGLIDSYDTGKKTVNRYGQKY